MQEQPDKPSLESDMRLTVNLLYFAVRSHSTCITPFIRHSFGTDYPGFYGVGALLLMVLTMIHKRDDRMGAMIVAWMFVVVSHRLRMVFLIAKGWVEHTGYAGWPWLILRLKRCKDEATAKHWEPLLCLLFGGLLMFFSPVVGGFIAFGFVSMVICRIFELAARRREVVMMQNMMIEQQDLHRRLRGHR